MAKSRQHFVPPSFTTTARIKSPSSKSSGEVNPFYLPAPYKRQTVASIRIAIPCVCLQERVKSKGKLSLIIIYVQEAQRKRIAQTCGGYAIS